MQSTASGLLLPDHAAMNYRRELQVEEQIETAKRFNVLLKQIDWRLSLVWVSESADAPGLVPGRWHVRRKNDGAPDSYMPILAEGGGYREPDSSILYELQRRDLWKKDGMRRLEELGDAELKKREKHLAERREEYRDELEGRLKAYLNPGVSMSEGWTYRAKAGKDRRKREG